MIEKRIIKRCVFLLGVINSTTPSMTSVREGSIIETGTFVRNARGKRLHPAIPHLQRGIFPVSLFC